MFFFNEILNWSQSIQLQLIYQMEGCIVNSDKLHFAKFTDIQSKKTTSGSDTVLTAKGLSLPWEEYVNRASRAFTKFGAGKPRFLTHRTRLLQSYSSLKYVGILKLDICRLEVSDIQRVSQRHRWTTMDVLYLQTRSIWNRMKYNIV